jgi:hypothetical protein
MNRCRLKSCRKYGKPESMLKVPMGYLCDADCATAYSIENKDKARQKAADAKRKAFKAETKAMRAKLNENNHKWQTAETQRAFNELARLLDADQPCIVHGMHLCGHESGWHAGHYLTVASQPALRFDLRNCFKQCGRSNKGDAKYVANNSSIRERFEYGIATMHSPELLMWLKGHHPAKHYTCAELADMRAMFREENKRLKRGDRPSQDWRQIPQAKEVA